MSKCSKLSKSQLKNIYWKTFTNFVCDQSQNKPDQNENNNRHGLKYMELTAHSSEDAESSRTSFDTVKTDKQKEKGSVDYVSVNAELSWYCSAASEKDKETKTNRLAVPIIILSPPTCSPIKGEGGGKISPTVYLEDSCSFEDIDAESIQQEWKSELFNDCEDETGTSAPIEKWMVDADTHSVDSIVIFEKIAGSRFIPVLDDIEEDEEDKEQSGTLEDKRDDSNLHRTETSEDLRAPDTDSESEVENEYVLEHTPIHVYVENVEINPADTLQNEGEQEANNVQVKQTNTREEASSSTTTHTPNTTNSSPVSSECKTEQSDYVSSVDSAYSSREGIHNAEALSSLGGVPAVSSPELANLHFSETHTIDYVPVSYAIEAAEMRKRKKRRATYASDNLTVKPPLNSSPQRKSNPKSSILFGTIRKRFSWRKEDRISASTPNLSKVSPLSSPSRSGSATTSPEKHRPRNRRLRKTVSSIIRRLSSRRRTKSYYPNDVDDKIENDVQVKDVFQNMSEKPETSSSCDVKQTSDLSTARELEKKENAIQRSFSLSSPACVGASENFYSADDSDVITEVNLSSSTIII